MQSNSDATARRAFSRIELLVAIAIIVVLIALLVPAMELDDVPAADRHPDLLALDEALADLERHDAPSAQLVKLRYFAVLSHREAAAALGVTPRVADRLWAFARAWLLHRLGDN